MLFVLSYLHFPQRKAGDCCALVRKKDKKGGKGEEVKKGEEEYKRQKKRKERERRGKREG